MSFTLPSLAFVFASTALLISSMLVFALELVSPARRHPEAGFALRAQALKLQQWLSLLMVLLALGVAFFYRFPLSLWVWGGLMLLLFLQLPSFWLRKVDLGQAIQSVHWRGAHRRSQQLQFLLLIQSLVALLLLVLGQTADSTQH